MKKKIFLSVVFIFVPLGLAFGASADSSSFGSEASSEPQQMLDFNLTGYGSTGQKTWEVQGASMDMVGNDVKISDVKAHLYGEKENMVLTADQGHLDKGSGVVHLNDNVQATTDSGAQLNTDSLVWSQKEQLITSDDKVKITKDNMKAVATGMEAHPDFNVAKLEKDVVLTIEDKKKNEAVQGTPDSKKTNLTITCDGPMELNYEKKFAVFENNVKVEGDETQGTMVADKMTVYFNSDAKQIERMEAQGNVKIIKGDNISLSDGAIFTGADKRVVLTGRPKLIIYTEEGLNASP